MSKEILCLTPEEAAAKAVRMRGIIAASVSELDMVQIMTTIVGQAKNGDGKMIDRLMAITGIVSNPPRQPSVGNVVQVNVGDEGEEPTVRRIAPQ